MPVIVVTRLRLRDQGFLDAFFAAAVALLEQATSSAGNLGANTLAEPSNAWWSCTAWRDRETMRAFVDRILTEGRARLDEWCDEATFGDWEQDSAELPDWQTAYRHLVDRGRSAELTNASGANETRSFPAPVETS